MEHLICDFYGTDIKFNFSPDLARQLNLNEPFLVLNVDDGSKDYYMPFSNLFYFDVLDSDNKEDIKAWCNEYINEIQDMWNNKEAYLLPNIQKGAIK